MASIYQLKPKFQALLRPLTVILHKWGGTANQVTLLAAVISILLGISLAWFAEHQWLFALLPVWMLLRMALNAIDGMLAREFNQASDLGAYLNELSDVVADTALYLPFALLVGVEPGLVLGAVLLAIISEYAGVMGPLVGASRRYEGPMGKSDRAVCFGAMGLLVSLGWLSSVWINNALIMMLLLLCTTIYNRVKQGVKEIDGE